MLFFLQFADLNHILFSNTQIEWLSLDGNNLRGNISFVCDWDMIYVAADCRGSEPEVNCNCCNTCCSNDDKEARGIHLSTMILIDQCWALNLLVWCPEQIYN